MNYKRGDMVLLPFPFVTTDGTKQKARPALIISDHSIRRRFNDLILVGITSQRIDEVMDTEFLIEEDAEYFGQSGLKKKRKGTGTNAIGAFCLSLLPKKSKWNHFTVDLFKIFLYTGECRGRYENLFR
jgi:hypothetical protein